MTSYDEDRASSQVNQSILEKEFGLDTSEERNQELVEIRELRNQLIEQSTEADPDTILLKNIERANDLLDIIQQSILNGGQSNARLFEVAGQLINTITAATGNIQSGFQNSQKHEVALKMLEVKEKELLVKQTLIQQREVKKVGSVNSGKVVFTDRESLLKMIKEQKMEVEIESAVPETKSDNSEE